MTTDTTQAQPPSAVSPPDAPVLPAALGDQVPDWHRFGPVQRPAVPGVASSAAGTETPQGADDPKLSKTSHDHKPTDDSMFSDVNGGLWAAITTVFCVLVGGGAHAVLLAAALGRQSSGHINWGMTLLLCVLAPATAVGMVVAAGLHGFLHAHKIKVKLKGDGEGKDAPALHITWVSCSAAIFVLLVAGFLCTIAWIANTGRDIPYQPIVGASLAVIAFASFGGYFLASRRARVGLASSFVLTFFMLFTFLLTLEYLNQTASGPSVTVLSDFMRDFRGHVALVVGFYFGSDAAVNIFKVWRSAKAVDPEATVRADRDIASPRLISTQ